MADELSKALDTLMKRPVERVLAAPSPLDEARALIVEVEDWLDISLNILRHDGEFEGYNEMKETLAKVRAWLAANQ